MSEQQQISIYNNNKIVKFYNNINLQKLAYEPDFLNIFQFIEKINFDCSRLYVDKFFNNINEETLIVLDDTTLRWLAGNEDSKIKDLKKDVKNKLISEGINFTEHKYSYIKDNYSNDNLEFENKSERSLSQRGIIIVTSKNFKRLCISFQSEKGKQIRNYFIDVFDLVTLYFYYTTQRQIREQTDIICRIEKLAIESNKKADESNKKLNTVIKQNKGLKKTTEIIKEKLTKAKKDRVPKPIRPGNHEILNVIILNDKIEESDDEEEGDGIVRKYYVIRAKKYNTNKKVKELCKFDKKSKDKYCTFYCDYNNKICKTICDYYYDLNIPPYEYK